jgi:hypothetical protein
MTLRRLLGRATRADIGTGEPLMPDGDALELYSVYQHSPRVHYDKSVTIQGERTTLASLLQLPPSTNIYHQYGITSSNERIRWQNGAVQLLVEFPWHRQPHPLLPPEYRTPLDLSSNFVPPVIDSHVRHPVVLYPREPLNTESVGEQFMQDQFHITYTHLCGSDVVRRREGGHDDRDFVLHLETLTVEDETFQLLHELFGTPPRHHTAPITVEQLACLPAALCTATAGDITIHAIDYSTGRPLPDGSVVFCQLQVYGGRSLATESAV